MIVVIQHHYMREVHKRRYRVNVLTAGELLLADDDDLDWLDPDRDRVVGYVPAMTDCAVLHDQVVSARGIEQ